MPQELEEWVCEQTMELLPGLKTIHVQSHGWVTRTKPSIEDAQRVVEPMQSEHRQLEVVNDPMTLLDKAWSVTEIYGV